ncbi:FeoA family protein [Capnocytophaga catalasegens]|uniref:Iron transporter FeoA n=1 Tax=Capnocytophaga catalasegens TaxID=1004260 RepID=A0AAV5B0S2_9FLAO|nr:FeoA family protein [Capnocytophaga catalasegens]GIZ14321.1 iron transporter FeoA [Capnocytophaga catalasegens]GJM51318.1 iron transporter FeoA [Capnocytophaga catalasegens]GJM53265.1 iron transporter FeoA [Capnocytophaga catalasegens]
MILTDLKKGEKAIITQVDESLLPMKLFELGCVPENTIEVLEIAPLGDPIYIKIDTSYLSIRKEMARYIYVEKLDTNATS